MPRNPRPSELADRIEKAADLIGTHGWCTGAFRKGQRHCMFGAVEDVTRSNAVQSHVWSALWSSLLADYGEPDANAGPEAWNDKQRDARKVRRAMYRAARRLRNGTLRMVPNSNANYTVKGK